MPRYGQSGFGYGRFGMDDEGPIYALPPGYYLQIITSEYQTSPKFLEWLLDVLRPLDDITNCAITFTQAFNPDFAVGPQLDVIGVIVGQSRTVAFQPTHPGDSPTLDDETYRLLLRARIAQNSWDGHISSLQGIWQSLFPGGRLIIDDAQNMSATVIANGAFTNIAKDLISHGYIVPRPEGVLYSYIFSDLPIFGFSTTNGEFIAGFGLGKWS